jgi:hypothetical protein
MKVTGPKNANGDILRNNRITKKIIYFVKALYGVKG